MMALIQSLWHRHCHSDDPSNRPAYHRNHNPWQRRHKQKTAETSGEMEWPRGWYLRLFMSLNRSLSQRNVITIWGEYDAACLCLPCTHWRGGDGGQPVQGQQSHRTVQVCLRSACSRWQAQTGSASSSAPTEGPAGQAEGWYLVSATTYGGLINVQ